MKMEFGIGIDIVFCLDASGDMAAKIDEVKSFILNFYDWFDKGLREMGVCDNKLRIKIIAFKDYVYDSEPMEESDFFTLPLQKTNLETFLNLIIASGGGDREEDGLEALALAVRSEWRHFPQTRRSVIIMLTSAPAHPLRYNEAFCSYPEGMPYSIGEIMEEWRQKSGKRGRLIVFSPDEDPWKEINADYADYYSDFESEKFKFKTFNNVFSVITGTI